MNLQKRHPGSALRKSTNTTIFSPSLEILKLLTTPLDIKSTSNPGTSTPLKTSSTISGALLTTIHPPYRTSTWSYLRS
ncbi:MAG: hypothetical protein QW133_05375 [Sulfolobales archaeon]